LYSESLKLSVDAKVASFHLILTASQARVGLIFHSADEKRVLSIDFFTISHLRVRLVSSFMVGIRGNSLASNHLIFKFELTVVIFILSFFMSSISTSSSFTSAI
jgi:hypothetical protein